MHRYAIQGGALQACDEQGLQRWLSLMVGAQRIPAAEFEANCDCSGLLDPDESLEQFCANDPCAGFYVSRGPSGEAVYFIQQSGFEFFFTPDARLPGLFPLTEGQILDHFVLSREPMAKVLLNANEPRLSGAYGWEYESAQISPQVRRISSERQGVERFIAQQDGRPVCGIAVAQGVVQDIFTRAEYRRQGPASE